MAQAGHDEGFLDAAGSRQIEQSVILEGRMWGRKDVGREGRLEEGWKEEGWKEALEIYPPVYPTHFVQIDGHFNFFRFLSRPSNKYTLIVNGKVEPTSTYN